MRTPRACRQAELLDGSVVAIRELTPSDTDRVIGLYQSLDADERYLRFFTMNSTELPVGARMLTDRCDTQCAIGCFESDRLIGVANYVVSNTSNEAEMAIAVAHGHHMRGVGTLLLRRLGVIAKDSGLHFLVAQVLTVNRPMLEVLSESGWPFAREQDGTVVTIRVDLSEIR
nr:GNAT family N-acetyltransferase [Mycolicibacterium komanii]